MDNQIKLTAIIDNSQIDRQISDLQRKIKSLRETGPGGSFSQLAQQYRSQGDEQKAQQIEQFRNRQNAILRTQTQNDIKQQENSLQRLMRHYENIQKGLNNLSTGTDRYNKKLEESAKIWQQIQSTSSSVTSAQKTLGTGLPPGGAPPGGAPPGGAPPGGAPPGGPGGIGGATVGGGGMLGFLQTLLNPKALGLAGSAIGIGSQFYKQIATYPERLAQSKAQIADMTSEGLRLQTQGRGYEMALFAPERMRALERAGKRVKTEKITDLLELGGIALTGGVAGLSAAAPYAGTATAMGNPLLGLGIGLAGGIAGSATAVGGAMFNDRYRNMLFDRNAYRTQMGAVFSGKYKEQLELEKAQSFEKDLAAQYLESNAGRFRGLQRQFGLSDKDLFLGKESIFGSGASAGYNLDSITQAMQGISAAGGSTAAAKGGGLIAAQMQRNLNLTNAPELLGRISGGYGMSAVQSKDEILRMQTQAIADGLDISETRNFLQAAAEMGYKTGGDLDTITKMLSEGLKGSGLNTPRGIEAAQEAMQSLRQQTGEMGGLTGQYQLAGFGSKIITGMLGKKSLTVAERAKLAGTSSDQITDEYVQSLLESRGLEAGSEQVKALKSEIIKEKTGAITRTKAQEEAAKKYYDYTQNPSKYSEKEKRLILKEAKDQFSLTEGRGFSEMSEAAQGAKIAEVGAGLRGKAYTGITAEQVKEAETKRITESGKILDQKEAATAKFDVGGSLLNLTKQADALSEAFKKTIDMGTKAAELGEKFGKLDFLQQLIDSSKATPEQKQGWQEALEMQKKAAEQVKPGNSGPAGH